MLSLEWLLLALLVFWVIGAWKRMHRLRTNSKKAFAAVEAHFTQLVELLRNCAAVDTADDEAQGAFVQHARQALLPSADLLAAALLQARQKPLQPETIAALDGAWQGAQVAWQAYVQLCSAPTDAAPSPLQACLEQWLQLTTLQLHSTAQFNTAVHHYNRAIAQFPACLVACLSGLKAGRTFQKDAALLMQPSA